MLLRVAVEAASQAVGGLQQGAVRGTAKITRLPRSLYAPGGPEQLALDLVRRRRGLLPLSRSGRRRSTQDSGLVGGRLLAALFAARAAEGIFTYPPLWSAGEPTQRRVAEALPHSAGQRPTRAGRAEDDGGVDPANPGHRRELLSAVWP